MNVFIQCDNWNTLIFLKICRYFEILFSLKQVYKKLHGKITWIIIQTHIRNTDSYSDTDSENLHISLSNQLFSPHAIKISQRVANDQIIAGKTSLQKSLILPIIRGVFPT